MPVWGSFCKSFKDSWLVQQPMPQQREGKNWIFNSLRGFLAFISVTVRIHVRVKRTVAKIFSAGIDFRKSMLLIFYIMEQVKGLLSLLLVLRRGF